MPEIASAGENPLEFASEIERAATTPSRQNKILDEFVRIAVTRLVAIKRNRADPLPGEATCPCDPAGQVAEVAQIQVLMVEPSPHQVVHWVVNGALPPGG